MKQIKLLFQLGILLCCSLPLFSQVTNQSRTAIQWQNSGSNVYFGTGYFKVNLVGGCTGSVVAGGLTITCSTGGTGTVGSGNINHLPFYAATGTVVSDAGADFTFNGTHTWSFGPSAIFNVPAFAACTSSAPGELCYDISAGLSHQTTAGADSISLSSTATSTTTTQAYYATGLETKSSRFPVKGELFS